jgi:hypothetical protein
MNGAYNPRALSEGKVPDIGLLNANLRDIATALKAVYRQALLDAHPIGSIYESEVSTNPGTLFGGTWVSYGPGRVTVGLDPSDTDFDTPGETRGEKTHNGIFDHAHRPMMLDVTQMGVAWVAAGSGYRVPTVDAAPYNGMGVGGIYGQTPVTSHSSVQPSIVVYRWKRTA